MLDGQMLARIKQELGDANPSCVEAILEMNEIRFGEWFYGRIENLGRHSSKELARYLAGDFPTRTSLCEFRIRVAVADLAMLHFVLREWKKEFQAIENAP